MAEDTIALMDALATGPAHLAGWSDGGNIALLVAMMRPDLVRKVVTMGANFMPSSCWAEPTSWWCFSTVTPILAMAPSISERMSCEVSCGGTGK